MSHKLGDAAVLDKLAEDLVREAPLTWGVRGALISVYLDTDPKRARYELFVVALNVARQTRRPQIAVVAERFEEVWTRQSLKTEDGALRSLELAPRWRQRWITPGT